MVLGLRELEVGRGGGRQTEGRILGPQGFKGLGSLEAVAGLSSFCSLREQVTVSHRERQKAMLSFPERVIVTHTKAYPT